MTDHLSYGQLLDTVQATGIWNEAAANHRFVLSPQPFRLSDVDHGRLTILTPALRGCLLGISRIMAIAAQSELHGSGDIYTAVNDALSRGTSYRELATLRPSQMPWLTKVDLMVDDTGAIQIAEIDGINPRGWGYSIVGRRLCEVIDPTARLLPGVAPYLAQTLDQHNGLTFLYGDTQRFYRQEFQVLARELAVLGRNVVVINETDIEIRTGQKGGIAFDRTSGKRLPTMFVDMPLMNRNKPLIEWMKLAYRERAIDFLIPPKHFLSSKAVLGLLANANHHDELERLLLTQITPGHLATVRSFLPPTYFVSGRFAATGQPDIQQARYVLKAAVSSGMKHIHFSDDEGFDDQLKLASQRGGPLYILQEEIRGMQFPWVSYDSAGQLEEHGDWQLRLTGYFGHSHVQDIDVTARRGKQVHGAPDAILHGTIIA